MDKTRKKTVGGGKQLAPIVITLSTRRYKGKESNKLQENEIINA